MTLTHPCPPRAWTDQLDREAAAQRDADVRRRESRRRRYALRAGLWRLSSLKSVKGCGRNVLEGIGHAALTVQGGRAGYGGLQLCSNLWSCPCCSARIRQSRAVDVEKAGVAHLNAGGGLYFLTLTMPHDISDSLADLLGTVLNAWGDVQRRKGWSELRGRHGVGFIRATETTYTGLTDGGSGWHPHLHVLLFTDGHLDDDSRADMLGKIEAWWTHAITRRGYRAPAGRGIGVNLQDVSGSSGNSNPAALFAYLTKVQDGYGNEWSVGSELLRGDLKTGRRANSRTPLDLAAAAMGLAEDADGNRQPADPHLVQLWHEYEQATRGRKAIHWSQGLREQYVTDTETPDEQLPETPDTDAPIVLVRTFDAQTWRAICRRRWMPAALLDYAEAQDYQAIDDLIDTVLSDNRDLWLRTHATSSTSPPGST